MKNEKLIADMKGLENLIITAIEFPYNKKYTIHYLTIEEVNLILYLMVRERRRIRSQINVRKNTEFQKRVPERQKTTGGVNKRGSTV